ncbi:MAG TPA: L,D-transpeptidase family protein [Trebonia sp.]
MIGASAVAASALAVTAVTAGTASAAPGNGAAATAKTVAQAGVAASPAYVPSARTLSLGMRGVDVKAAQRRLSALKYYPGPIDGELGTDTQAALWAFQEINGIKVTGVVDTATKKALVHPRSYKSPVYPGKRATRIEVSQALEVLVYYQNSKIVLVSHVSSGGGYYYNGGSRAITPNGTYNTTVYLPGWVHVPLGEMYNPVFFISTVFAIHGDTYVPQGPASHGCIRIPMDTSQFFHKMVKTPGTQVHVYGTPQWER